ncbi:hypothetical protein Gohar_025167, partial [Gossypium harknessii]|nr:hypothetical protein [Gossypium harknessii]
MMHGKMVIYGSLKVSTSVEKVNQVWQVGPRVTNDHPMKHELMKGNLGSSGELKSIDKVSSTSASSISLAPADNDMGRGWR